MMTMKIRRAASYLILAVFYLAAFQTAQAGVEETLAELNGKPSEEREKVLIEHARKEGTLTFYAATNLRDTQEVVAGFNKRYPFIKVAFSSLGGPGVLNKVSTEYCAGAYQVDVVTLTGSYVRELSDCEGLSRLCSPNLDFRPRDSVALAGES